MRLQQDVNAPQRTLNDLPEFNFTWEDIDGGKYIPKIVDFSLEHGSIFRFRIEQLNGPLTGIMLVGPDANRFVFNTQRQAFSHEQGWTPILGGMVGRGLINMDDPDHAVHRKMWNPAFTTDVMQAYIPVLHRIIAQKIETYAQQPHINTHVESQEITFDVAAAALAGIQQGPVLDRLRALFWRMLHADDINSEDDYLAMMSEVQGEMVPMLIGLIEERRSRPPSTKDVLSQIVHAEFEDGSKLDNIQILGHLNVLLLAGHETTTSLSSWLIYQLATLEDHWAELQTEVDEVLADIPIGQTDAGFPADKLRKLVKLENFIKETGRLYSPVFQVPRILLEDVVYEDVLIPAGTRARLSLAATHMNPEIFSQPESFDPERFAPPRREDRARPYSLVTFGGGPRMCIGINFAMFEVKILAAQILRHYQLEAVSRPDKVHVGYWNSAPKYPLEVAFRPR
ncbi:MAG: cytochrome P450 [Chloroflexota bacterium]